MRPTANGSYVPKLPIQIQIGINKSSVEKQNEQRRLGVLGMDNVERRIQFFLHKQQHLQSLCACAFLFVSNA